MQQQQNVCFPQHSIPITWPFNAHGGPPFQDLRQAASGRSEESAAVVSALHQEASLVAAVASD